MYAGITNSRRFVTDKVAAYTATNAQPAHARKLQLMLQQRITMTLITLLHVMMPW
jgi:hypothetical protein